MGSLRDEIVSEIAYCDKKIKQDDIEIAVFEERKRLTIDRRSMLTAMLELYDKEHPGEKEGENNATD